MSSLTSVASLLESADSFPFGVHYRLHSGSLANLDRDISAMRDMGVNTVVISIDGLSDNDRDSAVAAFEASGIRVTDVAGSTFPGSRFVEETDPWDVAWYADRMRISERGQWVHECLDPSSIFYREENDLRPGQQSLLALSRVARGADGLVLFHWDHPRPHADIVPISMSAHAASGSRFYAETQAVAQQCQHLSALGGAVCANRVAIVVDAGSETAAHNTNLPDYYLYEEARHWHRTLWELNYGIDIVTPHDCLDAYSLIIVPNLLVDNPDFSHALTAAAKRGAHIVIAGHMPVMDTDRRPLIDGYGGSLAPLLGVRLTQGYPLCENPYSQPDRSQVVNRISRSVTRIDEAWCGIRPVAAPLSHTLERMASPTPTMRAKNWVGEVCLYRTDSAPQIQDTYPDYWPSLDSDVVAIAEFDGSGAGADFVGRAAITRRVVTENAGSGKASDALASNTAPGFAWYIAGNLDGLSRAAFVQMVSAFARLRPTASDLPDGVEAVRRGDATFYLNHSDRAVELSGIIGVDLLTGNSCTGHVMLAPRSGMVVQKD